MHYCTSFKEQDKIEHFRCCLRLRKKFSRIYFAVIWFILFLVAIAFFLLSPTTKWFSKEFAILDEIISLIIVCFWTYRFMVPSFVKSKRRNWYKKILPEQSASLYVLEQTTEELAGIFQCSRDSIRMRLSRVRRKSLRLMKGDGTNDETRTTVGKL